MSGIQVKGKEATANGLRKGSQRLRVFYLPFYVPVEVVVQQLIRADMKVLKTIQDRERETGLMSNVWNFIVEVDVPDNVPDRMRWSFGCMTGSVLVNMAGRPPKCLRCSVRGHRKFECTAPYCGKCRKVGHSESGSCPARTYSALVSSNGAADREEIDDYVEEATDEQQTANARNRSNGRGRHCLLYTSPSPRD